MFNKITPEKAGIPSEKITEYVKCLNNRGANTHGLMLLKGNNIFYEGYWAPFHKDFAHRMYSQTKSYVGIAIGLLLEEGKLNLSDRIAEHFPEKIDGELSRELSELTIEQMLTMTTAGHCKNWFTEADPDRTHLYFNSRQGDYKAGTLWAYDSAGSQVLSALAEKLSGMELLEYLRLKLFNKMGSFKNAEILKTRNGDSWGDSALICTMRDMASFGRLLMQGGNWKGEQLISADYVKKATSALVDNHKNAFDTALSHGYGYQIWKTEQNGFAFVGMGDQLTLCLPEKDLMLVITSDNQYNRPVRQTIINQFFDIIVANSGEELSENPAALKELEALTNSLKLRFIKGEGGSPLKEKINKKVFVCGENSLNIKQFSFEFYDDEGIFKYVNEQGEKEIPFGINKNVFGKFPQLGYSNERGGVRTTDGFMYDDAASLCFKDDNKIILLVQIIDKYFGNMHACFAFNGNSCTAEFSKNAEDFLNEYQGSINAQVYAD